MSLNFFENFEILCVNVRKGQFWIFLDFLWWRFFEFEFLMRERNGVLSDVCELL